MRCLTRSCDKEDRKVPMPDGRAAVIRPSGFDSLTHAGLQPAFSYSPQFWLKLHCRLSCNTYRSSGMSLIASDGPSASTCSVFHPFTRLSGGRGSTRGHVQVAAFGIKDRICTLTWVVVQFGLSFGWRSHEALHTLAMRGLIVFVPFRQFVQSVYQRRLYSASYCACLSANWA